MKNMAAISSQQREMEKVEYFYHSTYLANKTSIVSDKMLKARTSSLFVGLNGVFFCVSRYWGTGHCNGLPNKSPYGDHRILIPVRSMIGSVQDWNLYYADEWTSSTGVKYIRMVLVKNIPENAATITNCNTLITSVVPNNNQYLQLSQSQDGTITMECKKVYKCGEPKIYTEVFVVGDINLDGMEHVHWDKVTDTGRSSSAIPQNFGF